MIKTKLPLVSVVIPAYNCADYIGDAINSILSQTYPNVEIIIIDDASTDETLSIVNNFAKKDNRIQVYSNKNNLGIGANRNYGIKLSKGEYICWQDADDISLPLRIEHQVEHLLEHPEVGVVGGYIQFFGPNQKKVVRKYEQDDIDLRAMIFRYNPVAQPASMFRTEVYESVGYYDSNLRVSEDLEMFFRLGEKYKFGNVQEIVLMYRQVQSSLTRTNLKKMEKESLRLRRYYSDNKAYKFTIVDSLYNQFQQMSMFIPALLRIRIFALMRGDK